jgi:NAD dependent epimerase/dehydratase
MGTASTALITGAGGFIGSHVAEALLADGFRVRALVRYTSTGHRGWLDRSEPALAAEREGRLEIVHGDVTDPYQMLDLAEGQDVLVHMAALIGIPYSYVAPASYEAVNVRGTLHVLEAARRHRVRRVIVTSTSEVYGTAKRTPIDETHPLQGQSPYAASKIAADKLAESYHRSLDLPVVTMRPFNTYGPRQSLRAVIPTALCQALSGSAEIRLGSLEPRRDLTFVEDTARAFVLAARAEKIEGETINIGSGEAHSVGEIAAVCLEIVGAQARIVTDPERMRPERSEVDLLLCDAAKAERMLGWAPEIGLQEGLRRTAEHLRSSPSLDRAGVYTV